MIVLGIVQDYEKNMDLKMTSVILQSLEVIIVSMESSFTRFPVE